MASERMSIQQIMERLGGEAIFQRLIGAIEAVALASDETGQVGKVTLTVKTGKPKGAEKGDGYVALETRLVAVPPSPSARLTGLYVDEDGLHGDDPRQQRLDLRAVPQGEPEARRVQVGQPASRSV